MRIGFLLLSLIAILGIADAQTVKIIPRPTSVIEKPGSVLINSKTVIVAKTQDDKNAAAFFNSYLKSNYGFILPVEQSGLTGIILMAGYGGKDGYTLESDSSIIKITGNSPAGTFYGIQTLIQLLPVEKSKELTIPSVSIIDAPELPYRGLHLDVGRHFYSVDFIKKYIDYIALHKLNYFHWHLTEDQGWRIEIKKYPKLTSVGAWRNGTISGNYPGKGNTNKRHGGFYTQAQVKDIVDYAAKRYITVIPEIEMPGHASAAIAAYPYLSCFPQRTTTSEIDKRIVWAGSKKGKQVVQSWGVYNDVFCAGKESTFTFIQNVLDEVIPLFPSKIIHVGGDECPKNHWKECPYCQKRIKDLNIKGDSVHKAEHYLQSYFVQRMEKYLNSKGKSLMGWDEILEGGLAPNAMVMSWRGEKGGIEAASQKHEVVMSPNDYAYFDHQQTQHDDSVTITNNKSFLPIEKVYGWNPVPKDIKDEDRKYILGGQANMWTEYMNNPGKVEYMLFPRIAALSEAFWVPQSKRNIDDFNSRLEVQKKRYRLWGVNYFGKNNP